MNRETVLNALDIIDQQSATMADLNNMLRLVLEDNQDLSEKLLATEAKYEEVNQKWQNAEENLAEAEGRLIVLDEKVKRYIHQVEQTQQAVSTSDAQILELQRERDAFEEERNHLLAENKRLAASCSKCIQRDNTELAGMSNRG